MTKTRAWVHLLAAGITLLLAACRSDAAPSFTARDSSGVRIVESHTPAWSSGQAWRVDSVPVLSIGSVNGDPALSFSGIGGVRRLRDGSIVVGDGATNELRVFDRVGALVKRIGREGEGPGELEQIQTMGVTGDTIWVYDLGSRRMTFFDASTGGNRIAPVSIGLSFPGLAGRRADGTFVFGADVLLLPPGGGPPQPGFQRPRALYLRMAADGAPMDTVLRAKGREMIIPSVSPGQRVPLIRPLFSRTASAVTRGDELLYGDQDAFEIRAYDGMGRLTTIARRPDVDLALKEDVFNAERDRLIGMAPEEARPGLRVAYEGQTRPSRRPAFTRFLVDADGDLWVQDYANDLSATGWSVFDPTGVWLGTVALPARLRPFEIRADEVLGVWRDDLDVEYVRAYPLRKGEGPR